MFRRLNKLAIWYSCVNALTTDYEICRNYPSLAQYFSPLLRPTSAYPGPTIVGGSTGGLDHPTYLHARSRWLAQGTRAVGWSVGRWYQISNTIQVYRFISWATRILSIRRPPHPLTYTNIDIETGILAPVSTDTDRLTKILYRNSTDFMTVIINLF